VADIHAVDSVDGPDHDVALARNETRAVPALIHNDINMDNVLLGQREGVEMPILNDFNIAVFRKRDARTGAPCRFRGRFANPQWMSPEQQERPEDQLSTGFLDEKIDIYALGNLFYKIAVGTSPWKHDYGGASRITPQMKARIARAKLRGAKPKLPPAVRDSGDGRLRAVLAAMDRCYRNNPGLRPSAGELARELRAELRAADEGRTEAWR
jgi:serine/threonine protein kinase